MYVYENKRKTALVAKLELLVLYGFPSADWSIAADRKSVSGGTTTALGCESLPRRQNSNYTRQKR
jgi:hypothetical protein